MSGETEKFKISFQFTKGSSGSESGSSDQSNPIIINSVETYSIDKAINLMNSYMARELNLSHCKVIIFSEKVATNGISNEIYTLINDAEIRPSSNVIVCKNNAKDYMENSSPVLENLITKYYDIFPNSNKYTGYVYNVTLGDFFNGLVCNTCETFAILGGVKENFTNSNTNIQSGDVANIKSTKTTFSGKKAIENLGVAAFKEDKLVR